MLLIGFVILTDKAYQADALGPIMLGVIMICPGAISFILWLKRPRSAREG